jgi:hypothetical protein
MSCNIIPPCPIPLPAGTPACCVNTMIIEYRNYAGCDLVSNTILPISNSIGFECSGSSTCVSISAVDITSCISINRISIDMDCLQTTAPTGTIMLNACWFTTISPSAFSITVQWQEDTQVVYNTTDDQTLGCCVNPVAFITYGHQSFILQAISEAFEPITNGFDSAIVSQDNTYPYQDTEIVIDADLTTPFILLPPGASSISGSMPNAIVTATTAYPSGDNDIILSMPIDAPVLYLPAGTSSISGSMPSAIVSYEQSYPSADADISINNLITSPITGFYL